MPGEITSSVVALSLGQIAQYHSQQDPTFKTSLAYTRLTATSALEKLKEQGFTQEQLPCASTMAQVLNRMGYGLPKVVKAKPQKKFHKRMISSTTSKNFSRNQQTSLKVKGLSMDCKATVNIGGWLFSWWKNQRRQSS
ncbi:Mobile element protein [Richelia intracellularis]|nr:Mobile element protein [Richelia intracellularis]